MLQLFQLIILYPFYLLGYAVGFVWRAILRGWYGGFYVVELRAREELTDELKEELTRSESLLADAEVKEVEENEDES